MLWIGATISCAIWYIHMIIMVAIDFQKLNNRLHCTVGRWLMRKYIMGAQVSHVISLSIVSYLEKCSHSPSIPRANVVYKLTGICHPQGSLYRRLEHWMVPKHLAFFSVNRANPDFIQGTDCWCCGVSCQRQVNTKLNAVKCCYHWILTT